MVFCIGATLYLLLPLLLLLVLLLLLCITDLLLKSDYYACGNLCLMRLWYKKGSMLLRTGNTIFEVKAKNNYRVRINLSWKVKVMITNVYIYIWEPLSVQLPEKCNCLEIGTWDQLWDNKWRPRINILSDKIHLSYYHIKIWSCDTIVCLFGLCKTGQVIWISNKVNDPTMSGVVLVLMLVRSLLAWSRLLVKHEMRAAELSDELESEVQASAVSVREFRCEGHRQTFTRTYVFVF